MREYAVGDEPVPGYQITRHLGAGGYGTVWVAKSPGDVEIALKIINLQGQGLKEFRAISLVKRLRHPNLIPIYAFWLKDEYGNFLDSTAQDSVNLRGRSSDLIIAMGLGEMSLTQRLDLCCQDFAKRHGLPDTEGSMIAKLNELGGSDLAGIPAGELLEYMFGAAKAIDYLNSPTHNLGAGPTASIQHCDIKPGNLLIVSNEIQVCDYGLARALTADARKTQAAGTPAYMAPELIAGKPSVGTDQYSLAITYYELRTGKLPFEEQLAFHAHITGQLDLSLVSPAEQEILRRATAARPDQRYPHTLEMVRALREAITPTHSRTPISFPSVPSSASQPFGTAPSGVHRSGGAAPPGSAPSTPTITVKPVVLDDLIRAGNELVPGHRLEKLLGRGGYGEVWEARMPGNTRCALKIVRSLDAMQGKQELRSLDLIRELEHDRLIRLQAYWLLAADGSVIPDEQIGQPGAPKTSALVIATDLAAMNLLQCWQECYDKGNAGIPKAELVPYMLQSAQAIDHLNFQEPPIVHRDIKPENILLSKNKQVKVSDFGLAKIVDATGQINAQSVGMTLAYAAPELFKNKVTRWTDQYSLAVTYYRLRVGRLPFEEGLGPIQMMQAHADGRLEFAGIGADEQAVLKRATAVEPEGRYGSCVEFVEALAAAAGLSRVGLSAPVVQMAHPTSAPSVAPAASSGPPWSAAGTPPAAVPPAAIRATAVFPHTPTPSDPPANIRETLRFEDLASPPLDPRATPASAGRPTPRSPQHPSSDDFQLPPERPASRPVSLPAGITETTTNVPSAERDTDAEPRRADWRQKSVPATGGGKGGKVVAIGGAAAALVGLIAFGVWFFGFRDTTTTPTKPTVVEDDKGQKLRAETATKVTEYVGRKEFAAAALAVRDAEDKNAGGDWAKGQHAKILKAWMDAARAETEPQARLAVVRRINAEYRDDEATKAELARLQQEVAANDPKAAERQAAAEFATAVERLKARDYAGSRAKLDAVKTLGLPAGHDLLRRAAEYGEALTRLNEAAKAKPTEDGVARLAAEVRALAPEDAEYPRALRDAYRHTLAKAVEGVVPDLGEKTDWDKLLGACRAAGPGGTDPTAAWVAGCAAESAAELLAAQTPPPEDALAEVEAAVAAHQAADPTGGYLPYAQARLTWQRKKDRGAADKMLAAFPPAGDPPPVLRPPHRTAAAAAVLAGAARQLRQPDLAQPFKPADAAQALKWLTAAARLSKTTAPAAKLDLALAAWVAGDKLAARAAAEAFATAAGRKGLAPKDAAAVLAVRAAVQDESTEPGRAARLESFAALLELYRDHPKDVTPDYINRTVIQPLTAGAGGAGGGSRARLLADVARLIQNDPRTWLKVLGTADVAPRVRDLYADAERLDPRAEYVVQKAFASLQVAGKAKPSLTALLAEADKAIKAEPKYAGGHTLRGRLLHQRAAGEADRARELADLREAVKEFQEADKLGGTTGAVEDVRYLYQSWSGACLLLGNFTTDPEEKKTALRDAVKYARKLTERDRQYFEGWMALGNASEDVAYFLDDTELFPSAVEAFEEAKGLAVLPTEARPWLAAGRCQYRRAEKAPPGQRAAAEKWLDAAKEDLTGAAARLANASPSEPVMTAEANYFLGLTHSQRASFDWDGGRAAAAETDAAEADTAFGRAAESSGRDAAAGRAWGRLIGTARCGLELRRAQAAFKDRTKFRDHLRRAKEFADQLRPYSRVAAFFWEGSAGEIEATLKGQPPEILADVVKTFEAGIKEEGKVSADYADQFDMARRLARWYAGGKLAGGKDLESAFRTMAAAAAFAKDAGLSPRVRAETLIEAGGYREQAAKAEGVGEAKKRKYLEEFAGLTRDGLALDPDHPNAWYWKLRAAAVVADRVGAVRAARPPDQAVQEARIFEETARYYREADDTIPLNYTTQFVWRVKERAEVEKLVTPAYEAALTAAPNHPEAWMWRWGLAEHFAADPNPDSRVRAREWAAAAAKAMPAAALPQFRARVLQLRKDLDERK